MTDRTLRRNRRDRWPETGRFFDWAGRSLVVGAGATILVDLWALYAARAFGARGLDWGLFGRWLGHLAKGRFRHAAMAAAAPIRAERLVGWTAHYGIGVAFAGGLLLIGGPRWAAAPTLGPALAVGLATVVFPFLVLQPGMGAGVAASKSPDPWAARLRSLGTHAVFGVGLYLAAALRAGAEKIASATPPL